MEKINFETICNMNENLLKFETIPNHIDSIAEKVAVNDCPSFVVPFVSSEINGNIVYKYNVGNLLSIKYFDKNLTKANFIKLVKNALTPFVECEEWFMNYRHFYLDIENIYIKKEDYSVKYIYIFSDDYLADDETVKNFIRELINNIDISDDNKLQLELCHILLTNKYVFSDILEVINKYEKQEHKPNIVSQEIHSTALPKADSAFVPITAPPQKPVYTGKSVVAEAVSVKQNSEDEPDIDSLFDDKPKTKSKAVKGFGSKPSFMNWLKSDKKSAVQAAPAVQTEVHTTVSNSAPVMVMSVPVDTEDDDSTVFLTDFSDSALPSKHSEAKLVIIKSEFSNAPQTIRLSFDGRDFVTIGRESKTPSNKSDYELPAEAKKIGRQHIRIEKQYDKYYIIDLATANHTYLNGQMLFPNQKFELENESLITFGSDIITYKFIVS